MRKREINHRPSSSSSIISSLANPINDTGYQQQQRRQKRRLLLIPVFLLSLFILIGGTIFTIGVRTKGHSANNTITGNSKEETIVVVDADADADADTTTTAMASKNHLRQRQQKQNASFRDRHRKMQHDRAVIVEDENVQALPAVKIGDNTSIKKSSQSHLIIDTKLYGNIDIVLLPELSPESVQFIKDLVLSEEHNNNEQQQKVIRKFHRAEKDLLLQGVIKSSTNKIQKNTVFGNCPDDYDATTVTKNKCPPHDPKCGCHGPIMTKGMVAWAAGMAGGPDFFINTFHKPVDWWDHQHTVWGIVRDEESFSVIDTIYKLPVTQRGGLWMLNDQVEFTLRLE